MKIEKGINYQSDVHLKKRKSIYDYATPEIDIEEEIIKLINSDSSILDVGCGNGDLLMRMRKQGFSGNLIGIDISEGILQPGIKRNEEENLNIVFKVGDAEKLEFSDNSFDVIISKHVLYHVENVKAATEEAYRHLKPKGLFIVSLNSHLENKSKLGGFYKKIEEEFGFRIQRGQDELNIENFEPFLLSFKEKKLLRFRNFIGLKNAKPYIDYLDSMKDFFKPSPKIRQWGIILSKFKSFIDKEIEVKGIFREKNTFGIFVATK